MKNRALQLTNGQTASAAEIDLHIEVSRNAEGLIEKGLVIGDVLNQNQALILSTYPGESKLSPTLGVGLADLLMDDDYLRFRHRIRSHFATDGMAVKSLELSVKQSLKIDAPYEN